MQKMLTLFNRVANDVEVCRNSQPIPRAPNPELFILTVERLRDFTFLLFDESFDKITHGKLPSCPCGCMVDRITAESPLQIRELNALIWEYAS